MAKRKRLISEKSAKARREGAVSSGRAIGTAAWTARAATAARTALGAAAIVAAIFVAYLPALNGEFVLDDDKLLTENTLVGEAGGLYRIWCTTESIDYWPASNSMLWLEWRLWGMHPGGCHATNLFLHAAEALLIWIILRKLSVPGAFWAAMLFAVHPVNVEAAAWISQRKDMLAMLFFLLSILWYLKADSPAASGDAAMSTTSAGMAPSPTASGNMAPARSQGGPREREKSQSGPQERGIARRWLAAKLIPNPQSLIPIWYWLSLSASVLAMLSKGSTVILPAVLLILAWWRRGRLSAIGRELLRIAPYFLVAVALTGVNVWFQKHGVNIPIRSAGFLERLLGAGGAVWFYLYKAVAPIDLALVYRQWRIDVGDPCWWLPFGAAVAVTAVLWIYRNGWGREFLFAWGFFCVSLVPVMGFTDVGFMKYALVADHYQHIAIIGVVALVAAGMGLWRKQARGGWGRAATIIAVAAACALSILTWRQSSLYREALTFYRFALEKNPDCWLIQNNVGKRLYDMSLISAAKGANERAMQLKIEAMGYYKKALEINSDYPEAHYNLGLVLSEIGKTAEAIKEYERVLSIQSDFIRAYNNLGNLLLQTGRREEAILNYKRALRLKPDYVLSLNGLGVALVEIGRPLDAIEQFKKALHVKPDDVDAYDNLTYAYEVANQPADAVAAAEKTLELAKSRGQKNLAERIETWLKSQREGQSSQQRAK
jgi:tetratricopeptide (TPR) repeat protein